AAEIPNDTTDLAGDSLLEVIGAGDSGRAGLSEYHHGASPSGLFMFRTPRWKNVHYVGHPSQLFDLRTDPREHVDLASSLDHANVRRSLEQRLRAIVDVDAANERAFEDQRRRIDEFGGVDAVRNSDDFGYTPIPVD
ncbi:MAG: choline-sulfatase, partial [Actinomycetota bacterium]|nr:choline-sulfatase [Actinomycetota bacterium]